MSKISTYNLAYCSTVFGSHSIRDEINVSPDYQRNGDVWTLEKKQLLIDSIINRYDIPKIYFHKLPEKNGRFEHAIIDGRQRLETIWKFIDGDFSLAADFGYLPDSSVELGGMTYSDLASSYPKIKNMFDATVLPIIVVETEDLDLIEDMFSRLNEAVPLNAAEKRNALGGACIAAVNKLSKQHLFTRKFNFSNKRYQFREVAIRLLYIEHCMKGNGKLVDTKKVYLDAFARNYKEDNQGHIGELFVSVAKITKYLSTIFTEKDQLLKAQSSIPIYYLAVRTNLENNQLKITRKQIEDFQKLRKTNRLLAEENIESAKFDLLEFDRLSQQGTNDASSIKERVSIFLEYMNS